jgi:hypothetical protein
MREVGTSVQMDFQLVQKNLDAELRGGASDESEKL